MKLCAKHWEKVTRSFGHEDEPDLNKRLALVAAEHGGGDPWFLTNIVVFQELLKRVNPDDFGNDPVKVQEAADKAGGCPVCFVDDKLLDDTIAATKELMARPKSPS